MFVVGERAVDLDAMSEEPAAVAIDPALPRDRSLLEHAAELTLVAQAGNKRLPPVVRLDPVEHLGVEDAVGDLRADEDELDI